MSIIVTMPERYGLPRVPCDRSTCSRCGASTWLSRRAELGPDDRVVCMVCAAAAVKPGDLITPASWVVEDLAELLRDDQP